MYPGHRSLEIADPSWHTNCFLAMYASLDDYFREMPDVFVAANLNFYYEEGRPRSMVRPDVFVVRGAREELHRRVWMTWKEDGRVPDFILEVTSRSTWRQDQGKKRKLYARLGVREYFQYDPRELYRKPALEGLRLEGGCYRELPAEAGPNEGRRVHSETLGLTVCDIRSEERLRLFDPATGEYLPTLDQTLANKQREMKVRREAEAALRKEAAARQREAKKRREAEAARQEAEAKVAELEARLRTLEERGGPDG